MPVFLDTNVLLYAVLGPSGDAEKRRRARDLLRREDCVLSVQVFQEFFVQATRASRPDRLDDALALDFIATWRRFRIVDNTLGLLDSALAVRAMHGFSLWDCMIVAATQEAGCEILFTEDLSNGQVIGGLRVENPFR